MGPTWAHCNQCLYRSNHASVHALSPSHGTTTLAFRELAAIRPGRASTPKRRLVAQDPNEVSVALWVEFGGLRVLLGADLEAGRDARTGWQAVVSSRERPQSRARVIKVPHHGSSNADDPGVWSDLLEVNPFAVVTPYAAGAKPLPTKEDCERLGRRTSRLFCTAPVRGHKPKELSASVRKMVRLLAPDLHDIEGPMGQVRLRGRAGGADLDAELFGRAFALAAA